MKKNSLRIMGKSMKLLALYVMTLTLVLMQQTLADDTDIYLNPQGGESAPLVMLSLDYRTNLGIPVCQDESDCEFLVDTTCSNIPALDGELLPVKDSNGNIIMNDGDIVMEDGSISVSSIDLDGDGVADVKGKKICKVPTSFLGLLRAAIRYVFYDKNTIKLGVMMSHDDSTTGLCKAGPSYSGIDSKCSNGGFILQHLTMMNSAADFELVYKPMHLLKPPKVNHSYQGAELFFEFYRYLTGRKVYNGHVGFTDDVRSLILPPPFIVDEDRDTVRFNWDIGAEVENYDLEENNKNYRSDPTNSNYTTSDHTYESPITHQCSKVSTMNFLFQVSNQENNSDDEISLSYSGGGLGFNPSSSNAFNEVIQKLNLIDLGSGDHDQVENYDDDFNINVSSYFYVKTKGDNPKKDAEAVKKVNDYAVFGGTEWARVIGADISAFVGALENDLKEVLSVSSTFVSSSVPVNVFNRAEFVDNVFMAIFEADVSLRPFWAGNLKRLELDFANNKIVDTKGDGAFGVAGKIRRTAMTFWTDPGDGNLPTEATDEEFLTNGDPNPEYNKDAADGVDGRDVSLGGAGSKIPGYLNAGDIGSRNLYTEPGTCMSPPCALMNLKTTAASDLWVSLNRTTHKASGELFNAEHWSDNNTLTSDPNHVDVDKAEKIMDFIRGKNADGTVRPWLLGDPMHSRPYPLSYGKLGLYTKNEQFSDIRILMASNDGYLRMFNNTDPDGSHDDFGKELWAFMPREVMAIQKRLMDNEKKVDSIIHPYGLDGTPVIYAKDLNNDSTLDVESGDIVQTFIGLRRGGKSYYSLDISAPDVPKFKWKISKTDYTYTKPDGTTGVIPSGDFNNLGLTFSIPKVIKIRYYACDEPEGSCVIKLQAGQDGSGVIALVFAGGYDVNKDRRDDLVGTNDTEGNAIYIVNADTGKLIKSFTKYKPRSGLLPLSFPDSMPSGVSALDTDGDGSTDRLYVGDTGGNIWRIDMPVGIIIDENHIDDTTHWVAHKLAALGRHGDVGDVATKDDRRFFHKPDVVYTTGIDGIRFDAVIIGSGDRANPKNDGYTVDPLNRLFMLKDTNTRVIDYESTPMTSTLPLLTSDSDSLGALGDITQCSKSDTCSGTGTENTSNGWFIDLEKDGEKMLASTLTLAGTIFANSYKPSGDVCGPGEGTGYLYAVKLLDATSAQIDFHVSSEESSRTESSERIYELGAGIPAAPVAIGDGKILLPGGKIVKAGDADDGLSYWYENKQ